jgi:hypothetical protein
MSEKVKYVCDINCPKCNALVIIKKKIKVYKKAEPADKEVTYFAEKGSQQTLDVQA